MSEHLAENDINEVVLLIKSISRQTMLIPLDTVNALIEQHELETTMMPFIDPTKYLREADLTRWHQPYLQAFRAYRKALQEIAEAEGAVRR